MDWQPFVFYHKLARLKMRYENITGIFFDVGWTLLGPRYGNWAYNTAKMHELMHSELFLSIPEERRREVFAHAQRFLESHLLVGTEEEELAINREFFSIIARGLPELGLTNSDVGEIARDKVYNMENYFYFDDAAPLLSELRGKYKLGVISDTWPSIWRMLDYGGLTGVFDSFTFSCFVGACKPDRLIYEDALKKLGVPAEKTIFVDDFERNLDGAAALGINPVLITYKPGAVPSEKYPNIARISELIKLL